jgi:hypothetical protein
MHQIMPFSRFMPFSHHKGSQKICYSLNIFLILVGLRSRKLKYPSLGSRLGLWHYYHGFVKKCRGWDLNPPQSGEISRKIPSFSVFGLLFGLFCRFRFYFSFEVVEWTSS